jgi:ribonuclease-3
LRKNLFHRFSSRFRKPAALAEAIKKITGVYPSNTELYELAFIHRSASVYHNKGYSINNERLEFLGDSILDAVVADYLFDRYPNENEGFLTNLRSRIVNRVSLNDIAVKIGLPGLLKSTPIKNASSGSIYGNALEAFIGAIYLDHGYMKTREIILNRLILNHVDLQELTYTDTNYKGRILDWAQKHHFELIFDTREAGNSKPSNPHFVSEVKINGKIKGSGTADSKKEAEQNAAKDALEKMNWDQN